MPLELDALYACPVCGETNALGIDTTAGKHQRLIEDCPVCCRPLVFAIEVGRLGEATITSVESE